MRSKLLLCLFLLSSCRIDDHIPPQVAETDGDVTYPVTVEIDNPSSDNDLKSSFSEEDMKRITDLNVFLYHSGRLLEDYSFYTDDLSSVMLAFPYDKDGFNIYMVGNVGQLDPPEDEVDLRLLKYLIGDYSEFRVKGVPAAEVFEDYRKGTLAHFRLKRLLGQYNVRMKTSASSAGYRIKDVRLLNCALDVYPFSSDTKAKVFTGTAGGDALTDDDISRLNGGETVSLYFIENLQGELLPDNADRRKKIPSSLESIGPGLSSCCTYIEITADITTPAAKYVDGKFRFYLGQNETTDFTIKRNTLYEVTLDFTQNMVNEEEWRIEVDTPEVEELSLSKEIAHVVRGIKDYVLISGPRVRLNREDIDELDPDMLWCRLEDVAVDGKVCQKLIFETDAPISGFYKWGTDYNAIASKYKVTVESEETYNGIPLVSRILTVYVHDRVFPLFIRMGKRSGGAPYQVEVLTDAPVNVNLKVAADLTATVEGQWADVYDSALSVMGVSKDGYRCCSAGFPGLYNNLGTSQEKNVHFHRMDVSVSGVVDDCCCVTGFYMGAGGKKYWGPGADMCPEKFYDLPKDGSLSFSPVHTCGVSGCILYKISSGSTVMFNMAPESRTCSSVVTTGTSNSLRYDFSGYNDEDNLPFYFVNGGLQYSAPVTLTNDSAKYLDDSARKSIIYEMLGPGRDVFYPNGVRWGSASEKTPGRKHRFGYTAGLVKQFFGNIHTWQIYQAYECDFYMTVNDCTYWPGASNLDTGFRLSYDL